MNNDLVSYYRDRALEYETIYLKPERQAALQHATELLQQIFQGKTVFEIACGTGYWTERIAKTAASIVATDTNATMVDVAKTKTFAPITVTFQTADIFDLPKEQQYESLFGGFIWSHIPLQQLNTFLEIVQRQVVPGGTIVFMDNTYVAGSNLPITERDDEGNTYQTRKLENGNTYSVLKNFPHEAFIKSLLAGKASSIDFINLTYYWIVSYKTKRP